MCSRIFQLVGGFRGACTRPTGHSGACGHTDAVVNTTVSRNLRAA